MQQAQTQPRVQKCTGHPTSLLSRQLRAGNDMDILKRLPGYPEECPCVFASVPSISASPRKPSIADQSLQSRNQSHMGPGQSFDPVWVLMVMFGIMQVRGSTGAVPPMHSMQNTLELRAAAVDLVPVLRALSSLRCSRSHRIHLNKAFRL